MKIAMHVSVHFHPQYLCYATRCTNLHSHDLIADLDVIDISVFRGTDGRILC